MAPALSHHLARRHPRPLAACCNDAGGSRRPAGRRLSLFGRIFIASAVQPCGAKSDRRSHRGRLAPQQLAVRHRIVTRGKVGWEGLGPTWPCGQRILVAARLRRTSIPQYLVVVGRPPTAHGIAGACIGPDSSHASSPAVPVGAHQLGRSLRAGTAHGARVAEARSRRPVARASTACCLRSRRRF